MKSEHAKGSGGLKELAQFAVSFVLFSLLINAAGISQWAQRLEIGNAYVPRARLVAITGAWEQFIEPTGLNSVRYAILAWRNGNAEIKPVLSEQSDKLIKHAANAEVPNKPVGLKKQAQMNMHRKDVVKPRIIEIKEPIRTLKAAPAIKKQPPHNRIAAIPTVKKQPLHSRIATAPTESYIVLAGDSMMAVGLARGLRKVIMKNSQKKVIRAYKSGTGLARLDYFNWLTEYPRMLAGKSPDIVICAIGINDAQDIIVNKRYRHFGTSQWKAAYANRVKEFIQLMRKGGATVYWVLSPYMRRSEHNALMQKLNTFVKEILSNTPGVVVISPDEFIVGGPSNKYTPYVLGNNNHMVRVRQEDGTHLSFVGGERLATGIWNIVMEQEKAIHPPQEKHIPPSNQDS